MKIDFLFIYLQCCLNEKLFSQFAYFEVKQSLWKILHMNLLRTYIFIVQARGLQELFFQKYATCMGKK